MAVRTLTRAVVVLLLVCLTCSPALACFGPKLFVGVGQGPQQELLYALITLYVQEKTGVESTRVEIAPGRNALDLLSAEKADLVLVQADPPPANTVFQLAGLPLLATGPRPLDNLQFTTVLPAIAKLNRLLDAKDVATLAEQVASGDSPMATARQFLMDRRLI